MAYYSLAYNCSVEYCKLTCKKLFNLSYFNDKDE